MIVELGDDATYLVRGVYSISFQMPSGDVLQLDSVLPVLEFKEHLFSTFCMRNIHCRVAFEGQQSTMTSQPVEFGQRGEKGWPLRKIVDPVALVHYIEKLDEPSNLKTHVEHAWQDSMETISEPMMDSVLDSKIQDVEIIACDGYSDTSTR